MITTLSELEAKVLAGEATHNELMQGQPLLDNLINVFFEFQKAQERFAMAQSAADRYRNGKLRVVGEAKTPLSWIEASLPNGDRL